jgi:hypothetical protein
MAENIKNGSRGVLKEIQVLDCVVQVSTDFYLLRLQLSVRNPSGIQSRLDLFVYTQLWQSG